MGARFSHAHATAMLAVRCVDVYWHCSKHLPGLFYDCCIKLASACGGTQASVKAAAHCVHRILTQKHNTPSQLIVQSIKGDSCEY